MQHKTGDDRARELGELIHSHLRHVSNYFPAGVDPVEGSRAEEEATALAELPEGKEWARCHATAINAGGLLIAVSGDHLATLSKLLDPPLPLWGLGVIARAVIETAATAYWLLDPSVDAKERVERSFAVRHRSAVEATDATAHLLKGWKDPNKSVTKIRDEAALLGIEIQPMPRPTQLAGAVLENHTTERSVGEGVYKYLSGQGHGAIYAAIQHFRDSGPAENPFMRKMEPHLTIEAVSWMVTVSLGANTSAVDRAIHLSGVDAWAWDSWQRKVKKDLLITPVQTILDAGQDAAAEWSKPAT